MGLRVQPVHACITRVSSGAVGDWHLWGFMQAALDAVRTVAGALVRLRQPDALVGLRSLAVSGLAPLSQLLANGAHKSPHFSGGDDSGGSGRAVDVGRGGAPVSWRPADFDWLRGLELQVRSGTCTAAEADRVTAQCCD